MFIYEHFDGKLKEIAQKIISGERISNNEGLFLYNDAEPGTLGFLANYVKEKKNGNYAFFNRNFHIEPSNICVNHCKFCSYRKDTNEQGCWDISLDEILATVKKYANQSYTEVHIVGGVHPERDINYYAGMVKEIKKLNPELHIKAFSAVEIDYMAKKSGLSVEDGIQILKRNGLGSIPGGGAEIFDETVREQICPGKTPSTRWLEIHEAVHRAGLFSNATMLYGHIESYGHRLDHLDRLRSLQDKTRGFNAFIPLKFKRENNLLSNINEVSTLEDIKNYAVSRIYLDNFPHVKAYWPMIGKDTAQLALSFGVDDIDGTIEDSTQIYSMAGADDKSPRMSIEELVEIIRKVNRQPVERDSMYNIIKLY